MTQQVLVMVHTHAVAGTTPEFNVSMQRLQDSLSEFLQLNDALNEDTRQQHGDSQVRSPRRLALFITVDRARPLQCWHRRLRADY
jgi:hypothetical protein